MIPRVPFALLTSTRFVCGLCELSPAAAHLLNAACAQVERRGGSGSDALTFIVGTKDRDYILQAKHTKELEEWMSVLTPVQQCAELLHKATMAKNAGRVRCPCAMLSSIHSAHRPS